MSTRKTSNIPASIAARVRNWAAANARTFQHALNRYVTERFFARLEASEFAERLVLKGGNLLVVWFSGKDYRPTMDTDFLCRGRSLDENEICAYPMATAVAEKCAIMVELGFENSRMKDYHDIWTILNRFDIPDENLRKALSRTFARRGIDTADETPLCFTKALADDPKKAIQWRAYLKKTKSEKATQPFLQKWRTLLLND